MTSHAKNIVKTLFLIFNCIVYTVVMAVLVWNGITHLVMTKPAVGNYNGDLSDAVAERGFIGLIFAVILALVSLFLGVAVYFPKEVKKAIIPQKDKPTEV